MFCHRLRIPTHKCKWMSPSCHYKTRQRSSYVFQGNIHRHLYWMKNKNDNEKNVIDNDWCHVAWPKIRTMIGILLRHFLPSPVNPVRQVHLKEPTVSLQYASAEQSCVSREHSLASILEQIRNKKSRKHVLLLYFWIVKSDFPQKPLHKNLSPFSGQEKFEIYFVVCLTLLMLV